MIGIEQYKKIQEYKALGMSKAKTSRQLDLTKRTVSTWWDKISA